jgi:hypothetical protein
MWRWSVSVVSVLVCALIVWGCSTGPEFVARDEPWRPAEEQACVSSRVVRESPFVHASRSTLGGPSPCGAQIPFEMNGTSDGRVLLKPTAMLRCPMVPAVERWLATVVEPAARAQFGVPLAELKVAASYACRPMNHQVGGRLSEHGFANALDVSAFILADGRQVAVKTGWNGSPQERAFLRAVHRGGCDTFSTVLGPDADRFHHDHFHFDLARHGRDGSIRICK